MLQVHVYVVCNKSKCTDFPMDELVMQHLVDVYQRVGSDLGCMSILISTGLVASVVRYCCLCMVCFITSLRLRCREILNNGTLSNSV